MLIEKGLTKILVMNVEPYQAKVVMNMVNFIKDYFIGLKHDLTYTLPNHDLVKVNFDLDAEWYQVELLTHHEVNSIEDLDRYVLGLQSEI